MNLSWRPLTHSVAPLVLGTLCLGGCMSFNPGSIRDLEASLVESNPELKFESSKAYGVGALTLDIIDFAFVHDSRFDLSKISRVDVGLYTLDDSFDIASLKIPDQAPLVRGCSRREVIMRIREPDEQVQVMACIERDRVTRIQIFVLEPRELVIVNARGDFEALISSLVKSNMKRSTREADQV